MYKALEKEWDSESDSNISRLVGDTRKVKCISCLKHQEWRSKSILNGYESRMGLLAPY